MIDDLIKQTIDPNRWRACAEEMNAAFLTIDMDAARRQSSGMLPEKDAEAERVKAMESTRKLIYTMQSQQWPANRTHYTLGQLDTERLILCCERRILDWQSVFNAKAAFGTPEDLRAISEAAKLQGSALDLIFPLRHAAKPTMLVAGLRHEGNIDTVAELMKMGADPAQDNGGVFQTAVLEGRADIARVLARYGQNGLLDINTWVNWAKANRKLKAYDDFRQIQWEYGRFTALDHETLLEVKSLPDNACNLRIVYNFAARRVEEIHEFPNTNPRQNTVTGYSFDDYGTAALESAREKLIEMGGHPSDLGASLRGKGAVAKPTVFGLNKGRDL